MKITADDFLVKGSDVGDGGYYAIPEHIVIYCLKMQDQLAKCKCPKHYFEESK